MAKKTRLYQRLTRSSMGVGSYRSLWLGPDHLLIVSSTGYNEEYRRIMLRDIQAFLTCGSDRRLYFALPWGVIGAFSLLFVVNGLYQHQPPIVSGIFLTICAVCLIWNQLLGPTCHVQVITRVQTMRLPSLVRARKANRVLGRLQPLIDAAQADLVAAPMPAPPAAIDPAPASTAAALPPELPPPLA